jgi:hypothetical protein
MTNDNTADETGLWLSVPEAAEKMGITQNTLRTRMSRKGLPSSVRSRKGNDGRVQAWVTDDLTLYDTEDHTPPEPPPEAPEAPEAHVPASVGG